MDEHTRSPKHACDAAIPTRGITSIIATPIDANTDTDFFIFQSPDDLVELKNHQKLGGQEVDYNYQNCVVYLEYFTTLLTLGQEFVFRRNTKTDAFSCATGLYSDAGTEVVTPHRRNTRRQKYVIAIRHTMQDKIDIQLRVVISPFANTDFNTENHTGRGTTIQFWALATHQ